MGGCFAKPSQSRTCKKCGNSMPLDAFLSHTCQIPKPIIRAKQQIATPNPDLISLSEKAVPDSNEKIKIKVPVDNSKTKFVWKQEKALIYPAQIKNIPIQAIRQAKFQQKLTWFRINLESHRISWQKGSEVLKVDRWNILFSSLEGIKKLNLYKELKIQFTDEKVDDAGGLLRQWMHLCIKQIFSGSTGIFKQSVTDQTAYHFIWDKNIVKQVAIQAMNLLGIIIGKAIFQRISLNSYLDRTILRQLCSQPVHLEDVYSYDKKLYESWVSILKLTNVEQLALDGCVYHTHGQNDLQQVQLFKNGKNTLITNENRDMYITQMIHQYCTKSIEDYLKTLAISVYKIIPKHLLSIFQPYELEMVLNGPTSIDLKDWKSHTVYQGYKQEDQVIKWFWQNVQSYDQQGLRNLLHYCTGSVRVPILGFKYLQSNRSEIKPFTIRKIQYTKQNPFPKSHTCFNRLQLPLYEKRQQLEDRLRVIMAEQLNHFGLS